jgi:signal transduction histidine kinase
LSQLATALPQADTVHKAMQLALSHLCQSGGWQLGHFLRRADGEPPVLVPTGLWYPERPHGLAEFRMRTAHMRWPAGQGAPGKVLATGQPLWIEDVGHAGAVSDRAGAANLRTALLLPVLIGREVAGVVELYSEAAVAATPGLIEVLTAIGAQLGAAVERHRLRQQLTDVLRREQVRLSQDLHDTVGQELSGLAMLAKSLENVLAARQLTEAQLAAEIVQAAQVAAGQVRDLARGLAPFRLAAGGLAPALEGLVERTRRRFGLRCTWEGDRTAGVRDDAKATHLFLITREALTNAVRHAGASHITVSWKKSANGRLTLCIHDNGVGIRDLREGHDGLGLSTMRSRAGQIGAALEVRRAEGGGTLVTCTFPQDGHHELTAKVAGEGNEGPDCPGGRPPGRPSGPGGAAGESAGP